jgi:hypothetical protein
MLVFVRELFEAPTVFYLYMPTRRTDVCLRRIVEVTAAGAIE